MKFFFQTFAKGVRMGSRSGMFVGGSRPSISLKRQFSTALKLSQLESHSLIARYATSSPSGLYNLIGQIGSLEEMLQVTDCGEDEEGKGVTTMISNQSSRPSLLS
eukprot:TRINITY_DN2725_c0_g1_i3.p1 TRINITY_DN2725_c0_g1~~TRINITY_DN2725_c0_g1_i3.p1  ORF type:complete len:105 (+),score=10.49 TRINITY_DN2725_c0_g1_i3:120-434(+)